MKPIVFLLFTLFFIAACQSASGDKTKQKDGTPENLEAFADSLVRLDKFSPESIATAAGYFQRLAPNDSTQADSAAVMFIRHVKTVADTANEALFQDTTDYFDLVYNQSTNVPEAQKQFQQKLARNHLLLQPDGEGSAYIVPDYDWINHILQPKTSPDVDAYLNLVTREEKDPTLLDAALAIEPTELADRMINAENLQGRKLPKTFEEDLARKHRFYTSTLLFGSDNSPALEYDTLKVTKKHQQAYHHLLSKFPTSKAARLIKEWQAIIQAKDMKKLEEWRTKYSPVYD
jgi:hypothetical protein